MWQSEKLASIPGQSPAPFRLPRVSVDTGRGNVLFESVQMGSELFDLLLDIFEFLRASMSVVCGGHQMDRYLAMLDEGVHSTEGGLEGREPIGGLFRDIEEDLRAIDDSPPLYCEVQMVKEFTRRKASDQLTSTRISVAPSGPGVRRTSFLEHDVVWNGSWRADIVRSEGHEVGHSHGTSVRIPRGDMYVLTNTLRVHLRILI